MTSETQPHLDVLVMAALRRIIHAVDTHSRYLADRFSVTGPQLVALRELARGGEIPVGVLARRVHLSHPTMTGIVDRLQKQGLVQRTRDTRDRRRVTVEITGKGLAVLEEAPSLVQDRFLESFGRLEEWEQTQMLATLQRVAIMMDVPDIEHSPSLAPSRRQPTLSTNREDKR